MLASKAANSTNVRELQSQVKSLRLEVQRFQHDLWEKQQRQHSKLQILNKNTETALKVASETTNNVNSLFSETEAAKSEAKYAKQIAINIKRQTESSTHKVTIVRLATSN